MLHLLLTAVMGMTPPAADVVVSVENSQMIRPAGFTLARSPFALGGQYLLATAESAAAGPAVVRVAAPEGDWYVYVTWARHPHSAKDVLVRVGGSTVNIDQSRLANGQVPEALPRNDMATFEGVCSSGLYRLTGQRVHFTTGEVIEIVRSDSEPGTVTTVESVVFSPYMYLDDTGNDSRWVGTPTVNFKDYGRAFSGEIGFGLAFLMPDQREAAIEWSLPALGPCLLSANVNRGPSRAESIPLEVQLPNGNTKMVNLQGKSAEFGRQGWQDIGVIRTPRDVKLRLKSTDGGCACLDLLRLAPLKEADLAHLDEKRWDSFTVEWEAASTERPWLETVQIAPTSSNGIEVATQEPSAPFAHRAQVRLPRQPIAVLDADDGSNFPSAADGSFRIELARDYGLTLTTDLLRREPFVWLRDLGVFVSHNGSFASQQAHIAALADQVQAAGREPFRSTAEKYRALTGYDETRPGQDDRAFAYAYTLERSPAPRTSQSLAVMPEASYEYFLDRVEEPKHRRMFLGWPNVCQEFYVLSNGAIGVSSGSSQGTGHSPAEHFVVQFGAGEIPEFKEHGDPSVTQEIEDGYHVIVRTQWTAADAAITSIAFAYPLVGEEVRTGNEPLAAFVRLEHSAGKELPLWVKIRPDHWGGPQKPLTGLSGVRIESSCLVAGDRIVFGIAAAKASITAASDQEVLVKLEPQKTHANLVIPYIAVDKALVTQALGRDFDQTVSRTKEYWDHRLAAGAIVSTPDSVVNNLYKTLLPRTLVCGDLDVQGDYVLKTSPIVYDAVWLHATAYGIEGLARRGHFPEARQYLEAAFRWQGSQASDAKTYTTWKGFFNAPPRYTALLWINFHGWMQWAAARYFLFSDDRAWLDEKLPALIESLEWTASQRRLTMRDNPDGTRKDNYGWLPPGRVTDGSAGTSTFSDCINWMGFNELTRLLERVGHPRAAEFRAEADDYRACILRGLRRAISRREPVRLNDGTFVPFVPGYLESSGHEETMWYAAVVDGGLEGILDSGVMPPGEPMEAWVLGNLEDNLFVIAPNLADEAYFLGHGCAYLRRDQPQQAIYTFYSVTASHMSRQTLTTFEHRSWGAGRVYDLAPWPMGYYTRMLAGMLAWDETDDELVYCRATPRAWLDPGKMIHFERLQTRFGPTSLTLSAQQDEIQGEVELPSRFPPTSMTLKLRVNGKITAVWLNDQPAVYDRASDAVVLPTSTKRIRLRATIDRK